MNTAVTSSPVIDKAVAHVAKGYAPLKMRNSPINPFNPGKPSEANIAIPINPQNTGATFRSPPKSSSPRDPARSSSMPTNQNKVAAVRPWLNICSITPFSAEAFSNAGNGSTALERITAKIPSRQ